MHPIPTRRLKALAHLAKIVLWTLMSAWLVLLAVWAGLHGWVLPQIEQYRPQIERYATKKLGVPVQIGAIAVNSIGMIPSFELRNIALLDPQGRKALQLPRVLASISPTSLLKLGFDQLYIDTPELDIRRTADGQFLVAGLRLSSNSGNVEAADWFFSQHEFVIHNGTIRWTDEQRSVPTLALTQVNFLMRNPGRAHLMRLDATPPAQWGQRFSLQGELKHGLLARHASQWSRWSGQLHAQFSYLDISQLRQYINFERFGIDVSRGSGALRAWVDIDQGRVDGVSADVALLEVDAQLGRKLAPLALQSVSGRMGSKWHADGFELSTQGLRFNTRDGLHWPGGNVAVVHKQANGTPAQTDLKADNLDLQALATIANKLPLSADARALIESFAPQGLVQNITAAWQGPLHAPLAFSAAGRIAQLQLQAKPSTAPGPASIGRVGVQGLNLDFDLTEKGGKARANISQGALDLPGIFEASQVPFDRLAFDAQWTRSGTKLEVQLRNMSFSNSDLQGQANASWHNTPQGGPGVLELDGKLTRANATQVHRYLPLVLLPSVRHYVRDAILAGESNDVSFKVKGNLHDMPFLDPKQGEFNVVAKLRNGHLAYVPAPPGTALPWTALTALNGELIFNRNSLEIKDASGKLGGLQLSKSSARIDDLMHKPVVEVSSNAKGPLAEALKVVNTSPLLNMSGQALAKASANGNADFTVQLKVPLKTPDKTQAQVTMVLAGNDVRLAPNGPLLERTKGQVVVSEKGFFIRGGQAGMLGGDVRFEGGSHALGSTATNEEGALIRVQGAVTAEGLRQAKELDWISRLAQNASGSTAFSGTVGIRRGVPEINFASNLVGLGLNLPAPLNKTAPSSLPVRLSNTLLAASMASGQKLQDQLVFNLGKVVAITYVRDLSGPEPRVLRGSIGVGLTPGESAPVIDNSVVANINFSKLDIDAWEQVFSGAAPSSGAALNRLTPASAALTYLPTSLAIRAKELVLDGHTLHNVVAGGSREGLTWRANLDANQLSGYLELRQPSPRSAGRLYARLARLSLAAGTEDNVEALLDEQPSSIPALDVVVDDFELRGRKLGRIEIDAVNRVMPAREWRLNKFNVILPEATLSASGNWALINAQNVGPNTPRQIRAGDKRRTVMSFKLDVQDAGGLLNRFGMKDLVRLGKGKLEGQIAWLGSPMKLDYPSLNGQFNVNVETGQFLKADPGIAKLLGVLSLQSLPRRLTLDFRDVFSEGFAFDFLRGDVTITKGQAFTNNLQMKGVNAAVLMEGTADIAKETQDIKVVVVPEINAGTASLVTYIINPVVGLSSFLAQLFIRKPLIAANTQEFHVDGPWASPRIVKVEPKVPTPTPSASSP